MRRPRDRGAWTPCAALLPALLLLAPRHARAQRAAPPPVTTAVARLITRVIDNSPGLTWWRNAGYNVSAIPPDFSQNLNFEPMPVQSSSPYINEALNVADAATAGAFLAIPGAMLCLVAALVLRRSRAASRLQASKRRWRSLRRQ
jgi:hypothetical protein